MLSPPVAPPSGPRTSGRQYNLRYRPTSRPGGLSRPSSRPQLTLRDCSRKDQLDAVGDHSPPALDALDDELVKAIRRRWQATFPGETMRLGHVVFLQACPIEDLNALFKALASIRRVA